MNPSNSNKTLSKRQQKRLQTFDQQFNEREARRRDTQDTRQPIRDRDVNVKRPKHTAEEHSAEKRASQEQRTPHASQPIPNLVSYDLTSSTIIDQQPAEVDRMQLPESMVRLYEEGEEIGR